MEASAFAVEGRQAAIPIEMDLEEFIPVSRKEDVCWPGGTTFCPKSHQDIRGRADGMIWYRGSFKNEEEYFWAAF